MFGDKNFRTNPFNLLLVIFVAIGTLATAYGLAIIGSTSGQPNCTFDERNLSRES